MEVIWLGSPDGRARAKAAGETALGSRESFYFSSDTVSLHVRLKPETRGILTARDLTRMRRDAVFVNITRAGLI